MLREAQAVIWVLTLLGANALASGQVGVQHEEVSLPRPEILNPEAVASEAPGGTGSGRLESEITIRRPQADPAAAVVSDRSPVGPADGRVVTRTKTDAAWSRLGDFVPLMVVLAIIGLAAWVLRRFLPARRLVTGAGVLDTVARLPVSSRQSLLLVKMGRRLVLLGVTPEQISTLSIVEDPEEVALLVGRAASLRPGSGSEAFAGSLNSEAEAYEPGYDDLSVSGAGPVRGLLEKVRRLTGKRDVA